MPKTRSNPPTVFLPSCALLSHYSDMTLDESVTAWVDGLRAGNNDSAQQLWERYFLRLVSLADRKLPVGVRRDFDEEDVAVSAFRSLCEGVRRGKFPQLNDRDNLWSLLVVITGRKVLHRIRDASTKKRGGGAVRGESVFENRGPRNSGVQQIIGREPTPEFAAEVSEESERLLRLLPDAAMRQLAVLKMEGYTHQEAAQELDCSLRTVERRLGLIRKIWQREFDALVSAGGG